MKNLLILGLLLVPFVVFTQQVPKNLTAANGQFIGFYQYTPADYNSNPDTKYPVIIFLHGIGERGDGVNNLPLVLANGVPKEIANGHNMRFFWNGKWETFLVLSPQLSTSYGDWQNFYVDEMIKYAKQNLRIDPNRIFLTGLSLGGGGVWRYASASTTNAKELAAIAPVCGTCSMTNGCNIASANLPVWAFHAQDDNVVGVGCTTSAIQNINNCSPAVKPLMTIYPDGGHWIWGKAFTTDNGYHNPSIYEWFLGQNKSLPVNKLPVANAGPDITISSLLGSANLSGAASTDPDGNIVRYIWRRVSGPAVGNIISSITSNGLTGITGLLTPGTYVYELTVVDNRGATATDNVTVTVSLLGGGGNTAPVAQAGSDQNISGSSTTLDGSGSYDTDGSIAAYNWTWTSGPSQYTLSNSNTAKATVSNLTAGTYQFTLTVTDNQGASSKDIVQVIVSAARPPVNQAPVANAGNDISITLPSNAATLNGSQSTDSDGSISSWLWKKISGPASGTINNPTAASTAITSLSEGTYVFSLTVTDNAGASSTDNITVVVNPQPTAANKAPVANAGPDQTISGSSVGLNGSGSYDPDGTIQSYNWTKINGPSSYSISNSAIASPTVSKLVAGTYEFQLTVNDNKGVLASDVVRITVSAATTQPPASTAPIARAGADIAISLPSNSVTLNGNGSTAPAGSITNWLWEKLSGPSGASINSPKWYTTTVTSLVQGTYAFTLSITDNTGALAKDTVIVTVSGSSAPSGNQAPVANAGPDQTISGSSTTLNGSGSFDPDGSIQSYYWTKLSGPSSYTISNSAIASPMVSNLSTGSYEFVLTVNDKQGVLARDTVRITVGSTAPANKAPVSNAGPNFSITLPTNSITLNGSASYDSDGTIVSWAWSKLSGPASYSINSPASSSSSVTNLVQGTYQFSLRVTDNGGLSAESVVTVTVNYGISPAPPPPPVSGMLPVAKAGNDITITLPTNSVVLKGYDSYDPDGFIAVWNWSKVSGPASASIISPAGGATQINNLVAGTYSFRLRITDNSGNTSEDLMEVKVLSQNTASAPPVADAGPDQVISLPNNAVRLNGLNSSDPDGFIAVWNWSKLSGPSSYQISSPAYGITQVSNLVQGTYVFRLLLTDNTGVTSEDLVTVVVNANGTGTTGSSLQNGIAVQPEASISKTDKLTSYPNPARSQIKIRCQSGSSGPAQLRVLDLSGRVVYQYQFTKGIADYEIPINLSTYKNGIYLVEVSIGKTKKMTTKFVKQ